MLREEPDLEVLGEANNGRQAATLAAELVPDVIVLDIGMPDLDGLDAARMILSRLPKVRIVALAADSEHRFVVETLKVGAAAYLLTSCDFEELALAIRCVHAGKMYLSPAVTGPVVKDLLKHLETQEAPLSSVLSAREREVLQLVAVGNCSKEIAAVLHVSLNTVIRHRQNIMDKLDIHNVAGLTKHAIREGLCDLG